MVRSSGSSRQVVQATPIIPLSRGTPAPMKTRSLLRVVVATFQPAPTSPSRQSSGIRTSERNTSLNSASPVIWRSGRISTPGSLHRRQEVRQARVLGHLGSVRASRIAQSALCALDVHTFCPLTTHVVAVPDRAGAHAGQVRSGAGLGEELAPDLLAGPQRAQESLLLLGRAEGEDRWAPPCRARCRWRAGCCRGRRPRRTPRRRRAGGRG